MKIILGIVTFFAAIAAFKLIIIILEILGYIFVSHVDF